MILALRSGTVALQLYAGDCSPKCYSSVSVRGRGFRSGGHVADIKATLRHRVWEYRSHNVCFSHQVVHLSFEIDLCVFVSLSVCSCRSSVAGLALIAPGLSVRPNPPQPRRVRLRRRPRRRPRLRPPRSPLRPSIGMGCNLYFCRG